MLRRKQGCDMYEVASHVVMVEKLFDMPVYANSRITCLRLDVRDGSQTLANSRAEP